MLTGTIDKIGNDFFVKYVTTFSDEPTQQTVWWKIDRVEQRSGALACHPRIEDIVTRLDGNAYWTGPGYRAHIDNVAEAFKVERVPVPCPKVGKKPTRWNDGRWEKLLARGWVSA